MSLPKTVRCAARLTFAAVLSACASNPAPSPLGAGSRVDASRIPLARAADLSPERWRGMTNIFFDSIPKSLRDSMQMSPAWRHVQAAEVVSGRGLHTVLVLRFSSAVSNDTTYIVDTEGTLDFLHATPLSFERRGSIRVANVAINVRTRSGVARRMPYQVLVSDDKYAYARIAEYRTGSVTVDGRPFAILVRNRGRNHPFFARDVGTVFMVDQDGDGQLAEQATLTVSGLPAAAEQVMPFRPFLLNGRAYAVTDIDSAGESLQLSPVSRVAAVSPSFRAPDIIAQHVAGGEVRLSAMRGRVVLLQFWATDCAFSERVRDATNQLVAASGGSLVRLAMSKERDRGVIEKHLATHPMNGIMLAADSTTWSVYNPEFATPHFVVIDQCGVVRLVATGVTALEVVTAQVKRLLVAR